MSVLYDALRKAERDIDHVDPPVIVPLVSRQRTRFGAPVFIVFACVLLGLVASAVGVSVYASLRDEPTQIAENLASPPIDEPTKSASQDTQDGIALSAQTPESSKDEVATALSELQDQIEDLPAMAENSEKGASKNVTVVTESEPDENIEVLLSRAENAVKAEDWSGALGFYDVVLARQPKNRHALSGKIFVLEQGDSSNALDDIDAMLAVYPKEGQLYAARARLLTVNGDLNAALASWQKAAELDRRNRDYRLGIAVTQDRLGNEEEALTWYRKVSRAHLSAEAQRRMDYLAKKRALFSDASFDDDKGSE